LTSDLAGKHNIGIGDQLRLGIYSVVQQRVIPTEIVVVENIIDKLTVNNSDAYLDWNNTKMKNEYTVFYKAFVSTDDAGTTFEQLDSLKRQFSEARVSTFQQALERSEQNSNQRWAIFIAVIIVLLISVMLAVFNTLFNNIHSRRKEFAILRVINLTKGGIMQVILTHVILYLFIGLLLGTFLGLLLIFALNFIDPVSVHFDYRFISFIMITMLIMALIIFVPLGYRLGKRNIILELTQDDK
jgi:putative ABC transport system permease protein